jgi:hypothetical protein
MKIEHAIGKVWSDHLAQMKAQMAHLESEALKLEGQAAQHRKEAEFLKRHVGQTITLIAQQDQLPPSIRPYQLNAESTHLIGEAADAATR